MVEHWLPKPRVASSSLVYRSKEKQSLHIGIANITFPTIKQCFFDNSCRALHCPEVGMPQNGNSPDAPHKTSCRVNATVVARSDNGPALHRPPATIQPNACPYVNAMIQKRRGFIAVMMPGAWPWRIKPTARQRQTTCGTMGGWHSLRPHVGASGNTAHPHASPTPTDDSRASAVLHHKTACFTPSYGPFGMA